MLHQRGEVLPNLSLNTSPSLLPTPLALYLFAFSMFATIQDHDTLPRVAIFPSKSHDDSTARAIVAQ